MYSKWTINELEYLKSKYGLISAFEIAKNLNRTKQSIIHMAIRLHLKSGYKTIKYTKKPKEGYDILNSASAYVLGVILGDGFFCAKRYNCKLGLMCKDYDFILNFKNKVEEFTGFKLMQPKWSNQKNIYWIQLCSTTIVNFIKDFNYNKILDSDEIIIGEFLKGLYDSEGSATLSNKNGKPTNRTVGFYNSDVGIIALVRLLLGKIGINYRILKRFNSGFGSKNAQYSLIISNQKSLYIFYKKVNFCIQRKIDKLNQIINSYTYYTQEQLNNAIKLKKLGYSFERIGNELNLRYKIIENWLKKGYYNKIMPY